MEGGEGGGGDVRGGTYSPVEITSNDLSSPPNYTSGLSGKLFVERSQQTDGQGDS